MVIQIQLKLHKKHTKEREASLTADEHYHLKGKRLTNVSAPVDNHDATTKKIRH